MCLDVYWLLTIKFVRRRSGQTMSGNIIMIIRANIVMRILTVIMIIIKLDHEPLKTRMLLQVHDELVFEAPEGEVQAAMPVIQEVMENAAMPASAREPWAPSHTR